MLEISTKRPTLALKVDGEEKELPVTLTPKEMQAFAEVFNGVDITDEEELSDVGNAAKLMDWFVGFAVKYIGEAFADCGNDVFTQVFQAWIAEFNATQGVSTGEA